MSDNYWLEANYFSHYEQSLQNVPPAVLVKFLREHRSEWADFSVDAYAAAALKANFYAFPGMRATRFTGSQIIMPLGHTIENEEVCFSPLSCGLEGQSVFMLIKIHFYGLLFLLKFWLTILSMLP